MDFPVFYFNEKQFKFFYVVLIKVNYQHMQSASKNIIYRLLFITLIIFTVIISSCSNSMCPAYTGHGTGDYGKPARGLKH
jgi:hypothetical protein